MQSFAHPRINHRLRFNSFPHILQSNPQAIGERSCHHQDDGVTHSGRKIPRSMARIASAKARPEKNEITMRHSLPSGANGKLSAMSPRAHRLLIASAKGSMNGDRSFSSSSDINVM
ncbi:hypothetical protein Bca52824_028976 [Brassica carinata]|uniref:Uncharacterized protein n=1 Tax=Brassica carinata TaxID=52824 RepID=A0A8X7VD60_BRACI|nr:hypothetical protein Bca52824_028976 [Brassica carinata]